MIGGQVLDTVGGFAENEPQESRLIRIHLGKTGALIEAACTMGAISGMQDPDDEENEIFLEAISEYGSAVGHMFQIVDDLIDVEQSTEHTGKKTKKDAAGGKLTYPGVYGVDRSKREVESLRMLAHEHLEPFGPRAAALHTLSDALARRTR
jgi:geranylgeranyl pyrophosphate synthase